MTPEGPASGDLEEWQLTDREPNAPLKWLEKDAQMCPNNLANDTFKRCPQNIDLTQHMRLNSDQLIAPLDLVITKFENKIQSSYCHITLGK